MIFLIEALILCLVFTAMIIPSVIKNPLAWISDYPPAIQKRAKELGLIPAQQPRMPLSVIIKKLTFSILYAVMFALLLFFINGVKTFWEGCFVSYGLWLIVDWYDALILDCIWGCHSKKAIIPGTEDMVGEYRNYLFHIKMSLIGMIIGLPICLLAGLGVFIINAIVG